MIADFKRPCNRLHFGLETAHNFVEGAVNRGFGHGANSSEPAAVCQPGLLDVGMRGTERNGRFLR